MELLILSAVFFVGVHVFIAGTRLRDRLVQWIGQRAYVIGFSLLSIGGIAAVCTSYSFAFAHDNSLLYYLGPGAKHALLLVMLVALCFVVPGLLAPSPTSFAQTKSLKDPNFGPRGIHRITRHPFLWGVIIWASGHLLANGDRASVVLFATFLLLGLLGARSIDQKRARAYGKDWERYAQQTSNLPFLAILERRSHLALREVPAWHWLLALAIYGALILLHPWLFGVSPLPG